MSYEPFHDRFPEIAEKETRTIIALNVPGLPKGEYGLTEAYCNESGCDCRRVFFNVADWKTGDILATIAYGWENKQFYIDWFGENDPSVIKELQGPTLNLASRQSELAPVFLKRVGYILQDKRYVDRLKRHYRIFKDEIDREAGKKPKKRFSLRTSNKPKKRSGPYASKKGKRKRRRRKR